MAWHAPERTCCAHESAKSVVIIRFFLSEVSHSTQKYQKKNQTTILGWHLSVSGSKETRDLYRTSPMVSKPMKDELHGFSDASERVYVS
ncbi:hypothetical protein J6590_095054 [Homalodisca vitripennis]|nr:hypothetical protein J6590_095054 [Homalodisca vitripennis]